MANYETRNFDWPDTQTSFIFDPSSPPPPPRPRQDRGRGVGGGGFSRQIQDWGKNRNSAAITKIFGFFPLRVKRTIESFVFRDPQKYVNGVSSDTKK